MLCSRAGCSRSSSEDSASIWRKTFLTELSIYVWLLHLWRQSWQLLLRAIGVGAFSWENSLQRSLSFLHSSFVLPSAKTVLLLSRISCAGSVIFPTPST